MPSDSPPKLSPQESGRIGAARRWGPPRVVRLDKVPPEVAFAIRAILAAHERAEADERASSEPNQAA